MGESYNLVYSSQWDGYFYYPSKFGEHGLTDQDRMIECEFSEVDARSVVDNARERDLTFEEVRDLVAVMRAADGELMDLE